MLSLDRLQNSSARIMTLELKLQADVDTLNDMVPGRDAMLKGIDPIIHAELLHVLMLMGHGDDLVICDINHPAATIAAKTAYGSLINLSGCGLAEATRAILTLFPLDTFVEKPVCRMEVVGDPERQMPVFAQIQHIIDAAEGRPVPMQPLERFAFYEAASRSFAIVRTSDPGPYGCFILKKGVISNPSLTASPPGI